MTTIEDAPGAPEGPSGDGGVEELHRDLDRADLAPLWTQREDLMPPEPAPHAACEVWRWSTLLPLAARAGRLVPVGRGGERRALALRNPGLGGRPYATPTLWAAVQYLGPGERAPAHRHSQTAFRFVLEGEGVWTRVDGDPVAMGRGDLLLTPGWAWHEHHNHRDEPMTWLDGLDIPLVDQLDAGFFEPGADAVGDAGSPARSVSERRWGHPGLRPVGERSVPDSPLVAYRWAHTDAALTEQLRLQEEGCGGALPPGHAAVRMTNPTTGGDALRRIRTEVHRLTGSATIRHRTVGSSVWQVFAGRASVTVGEAHFDVEKGDLFTVPSWRRLDIATGGGVDLFTFSDAPIYEALGLDRDPTHGGRIG